VTDGSLRRQHAGPGARLPEERKGRCPAPPNSTETPISGGADATRFARVLKSVLDQKRQCFVLSAHKRSDPYAPFGRDGGLEPFGSRHTYANF
jgi:hypothetical protein